MAGRAIVRRWRRTSTTPRFRDGRHGTDRIQSCRDPVGGSFDAATHPMRSVPALAFLALLCIAAPASAARGVASATIVVPVGVAAMLANGASSVSVSVAIIRDGANEHVTVAFN